MRKNKVYQCDYCSYYKITRKLVADHEKTCFHNPETRSCATCYYNPRKGREKCIGDVNVRNNLKTQCDKYLYEDEFFEKLYELSDEANHVITYDEIIEALKSQAESKTN